MYMHRNTINHGLQVVSKYTLVASRKRLQLILKQLCSFHLVWNPIVDPRDRPTVTAGSDHCFRTCRPLVRTSDPTFHKKKNKFQAKTMVATDETVRLAEWIIDDTCLVHSAVVLTELASRRRGLHKVYQGIYFLGPFLKRQLML